MSEFSSSRNRLADVDVSLSFLDDDHFAGQGGSVSFESFEEVDDIDPTDETGAHPLEALFEEDLHLLSYGQYDEADESNAKVLSLDEIPFDRDIRFVNVAIGDRQRPQGKLVDVRLSRRPTTTPSSTVGQTKELKVFDDHVKLLNRTKSSEKSSSNISKSERSSNRKNTNQTQPSADGSVEVSTNKKSSRSRNRPKDKESTSNNRNSTTQSSNRRHPRSKKSSNGVVNYDMNEYHLNEQFDQLSLSHDYSSYPYVDTSTDIMDSSLQPSNLRPDAPEFVPQFGMFSSWNASAT